MARRRGSKLYGVGKGKRKLISRSSWSTREEASTIRAHIGHSNRTGKAGFPGVAAIKKSRRTTRRKGRRKKVTIIERVFRWIRVPTNLITRR